MAIPVPRSYSTILGDMIDGFLSRTGLTRGIKIDSPILALLETAAQSDVRSTQDVMDGLRAADPNHATGTALTRWGESEGCPKQGATASTGYVTVSDSSFTKLATVIYQGTPQPLVGTTTIYVKDASIFPAPPFQVYLGRGTKNSEGPISVAVPPVNLGGYWSLTLATGIQNPHNLNESVVWAHGGDRLIGAGIVVKTKEGSTSKSVQFSVLYSQTLVDGETELANIRVVCNTPGALGRVPRGAISEFGSSPFTGAVVTNPLPFINGNDAETEDDYRERVMDFKASRQKGTDLAITSHAIGVTASDENKTVESATVYRKSGTTALYIDDGTGYEETAEGIAIESLIDNALGGEDSFELAQGHPIAKASLRSTVTAPYELAVGSILALLVGGTRSEHTFAEADFVDIAASTPHEVVASINRDSACLYSARTVESSGFVEVFARSNTQDSIELTEPLTGVDANTALGFPSGEVETVRLYKNDILLLKDGRSASITSASQAVWSTMASGETLSVVIDGTAALSFTFTDADFVDNETGYTTLARGNSIASWCIVLNAKIPGVIATAADDAFVLTSNSGASARASLEITGGSLLSKGMFSSVIGLSATGATNDYTLDRNTGQIVLADPLVAGDRLSAGSEVPAAFVESGVLNDVDFPSDGHVWFVVDGQAERVPTGLTAITEIDITSADDAGIASISTFTDTSSAAVFANVLPGDYVIVWDPAFNVRNRKTWRVLSVATSGAAFSVEKPLGFGVPETQTITNVGIVFVRSSTPPQQVTIPTDVAYTATTLVPFFNTGLRGATASTYHTTRLRVSTDTYGTSGDIAVVAANVSGALCGFELADYVSGDQSRVGRVESGNSDVGTPTFVLHSLDTPVYDINDVFQSVTLVATTIHVNSPLLFTRTPHNVTPSLRYNNQRLSTMFPADETANSFTFREAPLSQPTHAARAISCAPFAIGPEDDLGVVLDGDSVSKRFITKMYRPVTPRAGTAYGAAVSFTDNDNGGADLDTGFGTDFDWNDFTVYMKSRQRTHPGTTSCMLWRYFRHGSEGNAAQLRYEYSIAANMPLDITTIGTGDANTYIRALLPTGAPDTFPNIQGTSRIGMCQLAAQANGAWTFVYLTGFNTTAAVRVAGTVTLTLDLAASGIGAHGLLATDRIYLNSTDPVNFPSGNYVLSAVGVGTISYVQVLGDFGPVGGVGTVSIYSSNTGAIESNWIGGGVAPGDLVYFTAAAGFDLSDGGGFFGGAYETKALRIASMGNQHLVCYSPSNTDSAGNATVSHPAAGYNTPRWRAITNAVAATTYALDVANCTIDNIATSVNALTNKPVTATAVGLAGDHSGSVTLASWDNALIGTPWWTALVDGINYVASAPVDLGIGDYLFTFKNTPNATLAAGDNDWGNEDVRLVPVRTSSIVEFLSSPAVGGIYNEGDILASSNGHRVQISTETRGSAGKVEIQDGTASVVEASVLAGMSSTGTGNYGITTIRASEAVGLRGDHWVHLTNAVPFRKPIFTTSHALTSITSGTRRWLFDAGVPASKVWDWAGGAGTSSINSQWQVEKHGNMMAYTWTGRNRDPEADMNGAGEADWAYMRVITYNIDSASRAAGTVTLTLSSTHGLVIGDSIIVVSTSVDFPSGTFVLTGVGGATLAYAQAGAVVGPVLNIGTARSASELSAGNVGIFPIVRVSSSWWTFWIENPLGFDQVGHMVVGFLDANSLIPGDRVFVGHTAWGAANKATWTVQDIDWTSRWAFYTSETPTTNGAAAALSATNAALTSVSDSVARKLVKRIHSIYPNMTTATSMDIKFTTDTGSARCAPGYGTVLESLDKLAFPTTAASGLDGYRHNTGLIAECNKVLYGDADDPATYPGVVAGGDSIDILGPLIKRIRISLMLRLRSGASRTDISDKVRSVVAAVVNGGPIGQSIPISLYLTAAQSVIGVDAVTPISPTLSSTNDVIEVQPNERPTVLDPDNDIALSFAGD